MSKFVRIQTELRDASHIEKAFDHLKIQYGKNEQYVHSWSGFRGIVPYVVKARGAKFGLRLTDSGVYEVIGDDMQMGPIRKMLGQIQQQYAYQKVLAEVEQAGFNLVEESVGQDNVIRMTVRRWQ
ncbi:DUF1257 domain-containing protein [Chloroflexi bacterium TSY]|nr:DUF1257 domain-containing protein [Chloroflexi bacterium TSY]